MDDRVVGDQGFEPRQTESESVVLPLHKSPLYGGGYRVRTDDPELAKLVLSQLS